MGSIPRTEEIRVRNVALHRGGDSAVGSLTLRRHHLVFTYVPNVPGTQASGSSTPRVSRESSDASSTPKTAGAKRRTKDIWLPYPLINYCVLQPNHQHTRSQNFEVNRHSIDQSYRDEYSSEGLPPTVGTNTYTRPSTDSFVQAPSASPRRPSSPVGSKSDTKVFTNTGQDPGIELRTRDFKQMAFKFYGDSSKSSDMAAREVFYCLRSRCCVERVQDLHAFHFKAPQEETSINSTVYDARREFSRMGIGGKSAEGVGSAWRISTINHDYSFSPTYPSVLCVPASVSDNLLKYGGPYRSKSRIPALTYLHTNGGSITRSSQPMPGLAGKRNPQDERLVSAIFSSQTPSGESPMEASSEEASHTMNEGEASDTSATDRENIGERDTDNIETAAPARESTEREHIPRKKVYGTTRKRLIVDARPKLNALANRATGGGIEDVSNYIDTSGEIPERLFLDIQNIHVMRKSLAAVVESFGNDVWIKSDIPGSMLQDRLQKSGWLGHIAGLVEGSEKVAKAVGLGGDHVLVHCSDGWDRTSQVAAIAEVMLDPYYRSFAGFVTLIQKDFLSFGHKFNHRHGILGCEKWFDIENERVLPTHPGENGGASSNFGSKALSGAKNWFEKNRNGLFKQPNDSRSSLDGSNSRPPSPPANPILHSPATSSTAKDRDHKVKEDEIAPIFHQFLDAIYQLQHAYPNAFEFNERYLERLLYQVYSCQYGEFLFNNERERSAQQELFPSVWPHFVARQRDFVNINYAPKLYDSLLLPKRSGAERDLEIRWWSQVFHQDDKKMNTPTALARTTNKQPLPVSHETAPTSTLHSFRTESSSLSSSGVTTPAASSTLRDEDARDKTSAKFSPPEVEGSSTQQGKEGLSGLALRPALQQHETDQDVLASYVGVSTPEVTSTQSAETRPAEPVDQHIRLDYAAFAQSSAYSDR